MARLAGFRTADLGLKHGYFLTLTAPGTSPHKRWAPGGSRPDRVVCECHQGVELGRWNPAAGATWHRFAVALRREVPGVQFFRAAEVQERGALHHHVMLWTDKPLDVVALQDFALAAGYGCVIDLQPLDPARHSRYVAKYVTKGVDARDDVPWLVAEVDEETGEVLAEHDVPGTYRAWSASRGWGLTMREIREAIRRTVAASRPLPDSWGQGLAGGPIPIENGGLIGSLSPP